MSHVTLQQANAPVWLWILSTCTCAFATRRQEGIPTVSNRHLALLYSNLFRWFNYTLKMLTQSRFPFILNSLSVCCFFQDFGNVVIVRHLVVKVAYREEVEVYDHQTEDQERAVCSSCLDVEIHKTHHLNHEDLYSKHKVHIKIISQSLSWFILVKYQIFQNTDPISALTSMTSSSCPFL